MTADEIVEDLLTLWRIFRPKHPSNMSKLTSEMNPTERALQPFTYDHLRPELAEISRPICELAHKMTVDLPPGPDRTAGLRKLREAKDCFVTARVDQLRDERIRAERSQAELQLGTTPVKREG
jgi:hypothetical protein